MADHGIRTYRLGGTLLRRALLDGMEQTEDGTLRTSGTGAHRVFLPALDSAQNDCAWGRFSLRCALGAESMLTVRAFASDQDRVVRNGEVVRTDELLLDPTVPLCEKERLFTLADGLERSGVSDLLLNGQTGRWLWLWLEITGNEASSLRNMCVYVPGDNFFRTLPQVYQADNDFLQRYLSIFSTMYQEFQEEIDSIPTLLDVDTAPEPLLPMFASWLGLELDRTLFSPDEQRTLLKAAPELLAAKGTRTAVERAVKLFVKEPVYIVERNLLSPDEQNSKTLYGDTPYDFTVMVGRKMDERLRLRLRFLMDQLRPVRSRCRIVFLEECSGLDAFTYLDVNGAVIQNAQGNLDDGKALTGTTFLQ